MKLSLEATKFLQTMLAEGGWSKSDNVATAVKRVYLAGKFLAEVLPDVPGTEFTPDDKMLSVCRDCINWFISQGRCPPGPAMLELIKLFELYKE